MFKKIFSYPLEACYALARIKNDSSDFLFVASELDAACYAFDVNDHFRRIVVWPDVGGTMTIVPIPHTLDFLATQQFYPGFDARNCRIVKGTFNGEGWDITPIAEFPYLHRFDLIEGTQGKLYFVGCTIANSKASVDDWTDPGKVIVGLYDPVTATLEQLHPLAEKITMNHGYYAAKEEGYSIITGKEGVFKLTYPDEITDWKLEKIFTEETSDVAKTTFGQDRSEEWLSIQGFHGDHLTIYNQSFTDSIYTYPKETPFGHAIWGGMLGEKPSFIFGFRSGIGDLFVLQRDEYGKVQEKRIEQQVGPSNILVFEKENQQFLVSANHRANEFVVYQLINGGIEK